MKTNKVVIVSVCGALILAAAATGSFWALRHEKKPETIDFSGQTPQQIRAYLRSKDFNSLDEQTRRARGRMARRQIMDYQVNEYFSLPENKKGAYLDKLIEEMDQRLAEFEARWPDPNRPRRGQFARGAEDMRARLESLDPMVRAKMAAFREAMRARRQQRQ